MFQEAVNQVSQNPLTSVAIAAVAGGFLQKFLRVLDPILTTVFTLFGNKNSELHTKVDRLADAIVELLDALKAKPVDPAKPT